jgi:hypothetical protein
MRAVVEAMAKGDAMGMIAGVMSLVEPISITPVLDRSASGRLVADVALTCAPAAADRSQPD